MSTRLFSRFKEVVCSPVPRLPADFPFSPTASGRLYFRGLACYAIGTLIPLGLFVVLSEYSLHFNLPLAEAVFDEKNLYPLLAIFSAITFLSGFGAQLLYVRKQIHKTGKTLRDVLSLNLKHFNGSIFKLVVCGVVTFAVAAALQQGIGAIWPFQIKDPTAEIINKMHGFSFGLMALLAVTAPIFEEIIFRGFLFGSLRTSLHRRLPAPDSPDYASRLFRYDMFACFGSALMFGLMHLNLAALPLYVVTGMVFAEAYRRTGSLYVPMIGHFINNGLIMLVMMLTAGRA